MITEKDAIMKAEEYCSASEHCRQQVVSKLEKMGLESAVVGKILAHLEKEGFLDEKRYAKAFAHDKLRFNKWGRLKIQAELRRNGVAAEAVETALEAIDHEEYMKILKEVIAAKKREVHGTDRYERSMKLMRSVCQRGFEPSLAGKVLGTEITID